MYLKKIVIKNIGPVEELAIDLPFNQDGSPKPIVFVGKNGSGKTILQSQIIDGLYEIGGKLFDNIQIKEGFGYKYYKVSGGINVQTGKNNGFSLLRFSDHKDTDLEYFDKSGSVTREDFVNYIKDFVLSPNDKNDNQKQVTNIEDVRKKYLQEEWTQSVHFYQPAYRYEEPFWKNDPFIDHVRFQDKRKFSGKLDKEIEIISSTRENKSFLLDLVLDRFVQSANKDNIIVWENINLILRKILKNDNCRFGIGPRGGYRVSIVEDLETGAIKDILPSVDNLSLGESILLNFFINIIRHGGNYSKPLNEINGIVAIDEIDVHLHTDLQNSVLPELIRMFPKIQFIITTHSPLFLLGMEKIFGKKGFEVRNMPKGDQITTERFSEFENAYKVLKETEIFEKEIEKQIVESTKVILFVEGDYDTKYINKAGELLEKSKILEKIDIRDVVGYGNLNKVWSNFNNKTKLSEIVPQKIILLYDCDTNKQDDDAEKVFKRVIPTIENGIIVKGIENLFSKELLQKAIENKKAYIDITPEVKKTIRGTDVTVPEKWEINEDEKGNLCDWICKNGTKDDFVNFGKIFEIIEKISPNESITS